MKTAWCLPSPWLIQPHCYVVFNSTACISDWYPKESIWLPCLMVMWQYSLTLQDVYGHTAQGCIWICYREINLTVSLLVSPKMPGAWVLMHSGLYSVILVSFRTRKVWLFTVNYFLYVSTLTLAPNQWSCHRVFDSCPRRFLQSSSGPILNPSQETSIVLEGCFSKPEGQRFPILCSKKWSTDV